MREIKFRAWDTKNKEFVYLTLIPGVHFIEAMVKSGGCLEPWEQFVGILDKNGKEIYENDIIKQEIYPFEIVTFCTVLGWDGGGSQHPGFYVKSIKDYALKYNQGENEEMDHGLCINKDCEVIGNIYENPELKEQIEKN